MMINQDDESLPIEKKDEKSGVYDFLLKLKIRKDEDKKLGFEDVTETDQTSTRVCAICKKGFSSGKALGGHMRIHKPDMKTEEAAKPNINIMSNGTPTCMVCSKEFPSNKSLFGHMRSHPERRWRGVCPPPFWTEPEPVDLTQSLMGWAVTAKRGRKAVLKQEDDDEQQLRDCVYYLMMLAHGNVVQSGDDENLGTVVIDGDQPKVIEKKRKRKRVKQSDDDHHHTVVDNCKYKCSTCDKSFSTHQALGGHRSSAHKSNETAVSTCSTSESSRPCCKMLDFVLDLNQEPRDDEEVAELVSYSC